jgi:prepilin-type processing-associated H-X9-DG protein
MQPCITMKLTISPAVQTISLLIGLILLQSASKAATIVGNSIADSFAKASGAHAFAGKIRNANSAYADGHVVTHSAGNMKWELQLNGGEWPYIFY